MALVDALITLGPIIANLLAAKYFGEQLEPNLVSTAISGAFDLIAGRFGDARKQRNARQQFESMAEAIVESLEPLIEHEAHTLSEDDRTLVVEALSLTIARARLDTETLARLNWDPLKLQSRFQAQRQNFTDGFSAHQTQLYERLLSDLCKKIITVASELPGYNSSVHSELLTTSHRLQDQTAEILAKLHKIEEIAERNSTQTSFVQVEADYRSHVNRNEGRMHLFGLDVDEQTREINLSSAHVPLKASEIRVAVAESKKRQRSLLEPAEERESRQTIRNAEDLIRGSRRVLIIGDAGSGKTTILQWLAVHAAAGQSIHQANDDIVNTSVQDKVPFLFRLRNFVRKELPPIQEWVRHLAPNYANDAAQNWVQTVIKTQRAFLLVDGIDEFPKMHYRKVQQWLDELLLDFPNLHIALTSRPAAVEADMWKQWCNRHEFDEIRLQPLDAEQINSLIQQWHEALQPNLRSERERQDLPRLQSRLRHDLEHDVALRQLATTPLLCAMLCALNFKRRDDKLPTQKDVLYSQACDMLISKRDEARGVEVDDLNLSLPKRKMILRELALAMMRSGYSETSRLWAEKQIRKVLPNVVTHGKLPAVGKVYELLIERSVAREPLANHFDFVHRSFQEYLAAEAIKDNASYGELVEHAEQESWHEVIALGVALANKNGRTEVIDGLLKKAYSENDKMPNEARRVRLTLLAARCGNRAEHLDKKLRTQISDALGTLYQPIDLNESRQWSWAGVLALPYLKPFGKQYDWQRAGCIRALASIGNDEALDLLGRYAQLDNKLSTTTLRILCDAWRLFDKETYCQRVLAHLSTIVLGNWLTPKDLSYLISLPNLNTLHLLGVKLKDQQAQPLSKISKLHTLYISNTTVEEACIRSIVSNPNLHTLHLNRVSVNESFLELLSTSASLHTLYLSGIVTSQGITNTGLSHIAHIPNLQTLHLNRTQITDTGLQDLANATKLKKLDILGVDISDLGFQQLARLKKLQELRLVLKSPNPQMNTKNVQALATLEHLQVIDIQLRKTSDLEIQSLTNLTNIHTFRLSGLRLTDLILETLSQLKSLQTLHLSVTSSSLVTEEGFKALAKLPNLHTIYLAGSKITDSVLKHLVSPGLHTLHISRSQITDEGLKLLGASQRLQSLSVNCMNMRSLKDTRAVSDIGVQALVNIPNLRSLHLSYANVTDSSLQALANAPNLQSLYIRPVSDEQLTDRGLQALAGAAHLRNLTLSRIKVSDASMAALHKSGINFIQSSFYYDL